METAEIITKTKWAIDPVHSEIGFKVRHLMISNVRGSFTEYDASIYTTDKNFMTAEIDFWINPASISTRDEVRDKHLKSADFFDVEHFKEINFTGDSYKEVDRNGRYEMYGNLTIKGIKKQIKLDVEFGGVMKDHRGIEKAAFSINGKINRKDWELTWNAALDAGGVAISDEVWINCELELTKVL
jgi:polyisoprenoid-binding protein YceI